MKAIVIGIVLLTSLFKCGGSGEKIVDDVPVGCTEIATVTDFTGLDGCGLMFVLEDGTRLNPERRQYFVAPTPKDDPLYYFTLTAGQKVKIGYKEVNMMNACMAGKLVFVTCITKINDL